jgi:Sigma 54 modulation/S30EA ribosomal protein C terminus
MPYFPRPLEERTVIRHKSYALTRQTPAEAVADLELLDYDFHLFTEKATGRDSVVYRTPDGYRLAQAHPRPERPGPVDASVTVSEHPAPRLAPDDAAARLEALGQPFLFFVSSETGRGNAAGRGRLGKNLLDLRQRAVRLLCGVAGQLGAIQAEHAQRHHALGGQQPQHLAEQSAQRLLMTGPEPRDAGMIRAQPAGDHPVAYVLHARLFDHPAGPLALGIGVKQ